MCANRRTYASARRKSISLERRIAQRVVDCGRMHAADERDGVELPALQRAQRIDVAEVDEGAVRFGDPVGGEQRQHERAHALSFAADGDPLAAQLVQLVRAPRYCDRRSTAARSTAK
jgi:hypothetical protein